jgi:acetyltransferase-like isoleucine patch superfamily enzyme
MRFITLRRMVFDVQMYLANRILNHVPLHILRLVYYRRVLGFQIGPKSHIFMGAWFDCKRNFVLGRESVINQNCRLDNRGGLVIGNRVSISAEVCILTADHDMRAPDMASRQRSVIIEDYVFIGTRAMILPGVTLGRGCAVAAGAVVTRDVLPGQIVAGIPARPIGDRPNNLLYDPTYAPFFV